MSLKESPIMRTATMWTAILCLAAALICHLIFQNVSYDLGILYGGAIALAGLAMIHIQTSGISASESREKRKAALGYTFRYLFYALMLVLGIRGHLNALAMLVGIMLNKAALLIYAVQTGKDTQ